MFSLFLTLLCIYVCGEGNFLCFRAFRLLSGQNSLIPPSPCSVRMAQTAMLEPTQPFAVCQAALGHSSSAEEVPEAVRSAELSLLVAVRSSGRRQGSSPFGRRSSHKAHGYTVRCCC